MSTTPPDHQEVLRFWFEEIEPKQWWVKSKPFDKLVRDRFFDLHARASCGELFAWRSSAAGRLAEVIVLDQFSRNMFRGSKRSFEHDDLALSLASAAIESGMDQVIPEEQRVFIYMPYMHSESQEVHQQALEIFTRYGNKNNLEYEIKHKAIIDQFGRYPHRNEVMGRTSTPEELEFLKTHS